MVGELGKEGVERMLCLLDVLVLLLLFHWSFG